MSNSEVASGPQPVSVIAAIPATTPFVGPETLERQMGRPFKLRLGANESLFGPSPKAVQAMQKAAEKGHFYGDPEALPLREAIAKRHGVAVENVVLGSGIDELLMLFARGYVSEGDPVVTTLGSYPTFEYAISSVGGRFEKVLYADDRIDLDALASKAWDVKAKMVYLANPDNPSGTWHTPADVASFRANLPLDTMLLLDEAYADFAPEAFPAMVADPGLVRFRTFSKAHGMAGIRVGYALAHVDHVATLNKFRMHFGVSSVAQAGALAALSDIEHVRKVVEETKIQRERVAREVGYPSLPSATNFLTIDLGSEGTATHALVALRKEGVFIRKPMGSSLDRCIRVTIGREEDMDRFLEIFREVVSG